MMPELRENESDPILQKRNVLSGIFRNPFHQSELQALTVCDKNFYRYQSLDEDYTEKDCLGLKPYETNFEILMNGAHFQCDERRPDAMQTRSATPATHSSAMIGTVALKNRLMDASETCGGLHDRS